MNASIFRRAASRTFVSSSSLCPVSVPTTSTPAPRSPDLIGPAVEVTVVVMLANQAVLESERRLNHVVDRTRLRVIILFELVVALPMGRAFRVGGCDVAKHDPRSLLTDHVPHRTDLLLALKVEADVVKVHIGMEAVACMPR